MATQTACKGIEKSTYWSNKTSHMRLVIGGPDFNVAKCNLG